MYSQPYTHTGTLRARGPEAAVVILFFLLANCSPSEGAPSLAKELGLTPGSQSLAPPNQCAPTLISPARGSLINDNTPRYSGTVDPNCTIEVFVNGGQMGSATVSITGSWYLDHPEGSRLPDGQHSAFAQATAVDDSVTNTDPPNTFTVDNSPPAIPFVLAPADLSFIRTRTPVYSGTADPDSTVTVFVDNSVEITADEPGAWSVTQPTNLTEGQHTFRARAKDPAGNTTDSSAYTFTVDLTEPVAPVMTTPANGAITRNATLVYSGTAEVGSTVTVIVDGRSIGTSQEVDTSGQWNYTPTVPLQEGERKVVAQATDKAGNPSPVSTLHTFTVDDTPPRAPDIRSPQNGSYIKDKRPRYSGNANPGSSIIVFLNDVEQEGSITINSSGDWVFTHARDQTDNDYTVRAQARDAAGNTSVNSNSINFTLDTIAPQAPVFTDSKYTGVPPTSFTGTAEPASSISVSVHRTPVCTASSNSEGKWTCNYNTPFGEGSHSVDAVAIDLAGNPSEMGHFDFTVDTIKPPPPVLTSPSNGAELKTARPRFRGISETNSIVTVTVNSQSCSAEAKHPLGEWECSLNTPLTEGSYSIVATAKDQAGNQSIASAPSSFTVIPQFPAILSHKDGDFINDSTPTLTGTAVAGLELVITVDSARDFTTITELNGTWSREIDQALGEGPHLITVTFKDSREGTSSTTLSLTVDLTPPDTLFAPDSPTLVAYPPSATFTFSSLEESSFECSLDEADFSPCASPATLEDVTTGEHLFRVRARDKAGNVELKPATYSWTRELAALEGSGCSMPGSTLSGVLAGLGLVLLAVTQRRRRTSSAPASKSDLPP